MRVNVVVADRGHNRDALLERVVLVRCEDFQKLFGNVLVEILNLVLSTGIFVIGIVPNFNKKKITLTQDSTTAKVSILGPATGDNWNPCTVLMHNKEKREKRQQNASSHWEIKSRLTG